MEFLEWCSPFTWNLLLATQTGEKYKSPTSITSRDDAPTTQPNLLHNNQDGRLRGVSSSLSFFRNYEMAFYMNIDMEIAVPYQ